MMKYECFIKPGWSSQDIDAESADQAREIFCELIRDNLTTEHIITSNLDTGSDANESAN